VGGVFRKKVNAGKRSCLRAVVTFQMIKQEYSKNALGHSAVFTWHKHYAQGRESLENDEHTGWPRTVRTKLKKLQCWCVPTTPKWQIKSQQQQHGLAMLMT
jgi:hypothetical protein